MILSAKALLDTKPDPTTEQIKQAIRGNLCRCTGYTNIVRAIKTASETINNQGRK
jgi:aerobic-type carbon monoxide dehydrogenase small subunit (CoxS/CutS family)